MTLRALDLFCGGGLAGAGLAGAGLAVVGVDHDRLAVATNPHPVVIADALAPPVRREGWALVWASPPCQRFSVATPDRDAHPDLIEATRRLLAEFAAAGAATVIENVPGAPIRPDITLTGPMVGLDRIMRRRHFEVSWAVLQPPPILTPTNPGSTLSIFGRHRGHTPAGRTGGRPWPMADAMAAMGVTHAVRQRDLAQGVPPPFAAAIVDSAVFAGALRLPETSAPDTSARR